jgi:hypothetical protein
MSKSDDSGDDSGGNLKVTDAYLKDVALNQINNFLHDLTNSSVYSRINTFSSGDGNGIGTGPGEYSKLMAGGGPLTAAGELQSRFQQLCQSLQSEFNALKSQMKTMSADLQQAQTLLDNAETDALTAAQMMEVLNSVYTDVSSTPTPGSSTNVNTPVNVNT